MGTRVVLACLVDLTRIAVYVNCIELATFSVNPMLIVIASLAAFVGAWFGKKWMQKSETPFINRFIAVSMILFAVALIAGLI